jgi:hypothetical protein
MMEWCAPTALEHRPTPQDDEVVSFAFFHKNGFDLPDHPFLYGLMYFYRLHLHDLTSEGLLHLSVFIMLCEAFLGIEP